MPQLLLNFPRILVAGCASGFEFRLINDGAVPLRDVRVVITCPLLGLTGHEAIIGTLAPGVSREGHVDVMPEAIGTPSLTCVVEAAVGREIVCMEGVWKRLTIYERPQSPANVSVIIQDIQSHRSEGEKAEFGGIKGDVNITVQDLLPRVQTLNDLIQLELPDDFRPVALRAAARRDDTEALRIPAAFLRMFQPTTVMHLFIEGETAAAESTSSGWRLCSSSAAVVLGRSSQDCDLVTRFLPATTDNNSKSATLSRRHASIRMTPDAQIIAEPQSASALLHVGRQTVAAGVPTTAGEADIISLGPPLSEYRLQCRARRSMLPRRFRVTNLAESVAARVAVGDASADWGRVEFVLLDSQPSFWNVLWFQEPVPFGLTSEGRLTLSSSVLGAVLGYIHHFRGAFWLECTAQMDNEIIVNGHPLEDGDFVPLQDGMALKIGEVPLGVSRIR